MAKTTGKPKSPIPAVEVDDLLRTFRNALDRCAETGRPEMINYTPQVDIYTSVDSVIVEAELPGVRLEDIDLSFLKDTFIIKGQKSETPAEAAGNYICMERGYGRFFRSIEMPFPVNTNKIKASYKNGILTVEAKKIIDKRGIPKKISIDNE